MEVLGGFMLYEHDSAEGPCSKGPDPVEVFKNGSVLRTQCTTLQQNIVTIITQSKTMSSNSSVLNLCVT